jgi:hypothetical protein
VIAARIKIERFMCFLIEGGRPGFPVEPKA